MAVATESGAAVLAEIARWRGVIDAETTAAEAALTKSDPGAGDAPARPGHAELWGRLSSLRARAARAEAELADPRELRAELATLSYFARTLRADAVAWRSTLHQALAELARQEAAARREREQAASERQALLQRRDLLQARIEQAAAEVAQAGGECRRTVPVIRLADKVTVASMTVSGPRRPFRATRLWLVTLGSDRDQVLVRPD
jgi:multidrug resistance efflux pump